MVTKKATYFVERLVVQSSSRASLFAIWQYHNGQIVNEIRQNSKSKLKQPKATLNSEQKKTPLLLKCT